MNNLFKKSVLIGIFSSCSTFVSSNQAIAASFDSSPLYDQVINYTTTIETVGSLSGVDEVDIYFPNDGNSNTTFPVVVLLQGALVDKVDYSNYASLVARYGFMVIVPNHERTLSNPNTSFTGFFPDVELINDVLDFTIEENQNEKSLAQGKINPENLGLLGHSFGGATGLSAIDGGCYPILCNGSYTQPSQLQAGIFYGANFRDEVTGEYIPIDNQNIATGLIAGNLDGVASLESSQITYNNIISSPKILVTVNGANHYGITNEDSLLDPTRPTLSQDIATETIARWSGLFLRSHLWDDSQAFDYIYFTGDAQDENVTVISTQVPEPNRTISLLSLGILGVTSKLKKNRHLF